MDWSAIEETDGVLYDFRELVRMVDMFRAVESYLHILINLCSVGAKLRNLFVIPCDFPVKLTKSGR